MPEYQSIARWFWIAGGVLAVLGAVLWLATPIRPMFPPYLATALLAVAYAAWCQHKGRDGANRQKS
jgi:hypothetical protein